jgi:O-antigen/teichoic acid export membrane protein
MTEIEKFFRTGCSLGSMVFIRLLGVLLTFIVGIVVARLGGPAMLGIFQLYNTWLVTLSEIGGMGLPTTTMREVSKQHAKENCPDVKGFVASALGMGISAMLIVSLVTLAIAILYIFLRGGELPIYFLVALPASIMFLVLRIHVEVLKGQGKRIQAVLKESVLIPLALIALLMVGAVFNISWTGQTIAILHAGTVVTLAIVSLYFMGMLKRSIKKITLPKPTRMAKDSCSLWLGSLVNLSLLYLPFYFLPWFSDKADMGIFSAAYRLVMVAVTLLVVIAAWYGPRMARAYANSDHQGLTAEIRQARWFSTLGYMPFFLLCLIFGEELLAIFGDSFRESKYMLLILCLGQLVNALTGLPGLHLNMVGLSRIETTISITSLAIGVMLHIILGGLWGGQGIAIAFAVTIALKNTISFVASTKTLYGSTNGRINKQFRLSSDKR